MPHLLTPKGFRAAGTYAGIKTKPTNDVGLLVCDTLASAAAVFTTNRVFAAPVAIGRKHVASGKLRGVVVNSGNANACTGRQGEKDAIHMCQLAAQMVGADPHEFLPSSTGIIGHLLPMNKIEAGIRAAGPKLGDSEQHALDFAAAILTTDTKRKAATAQFKVGRETVTLSGVCKGAGMIGPRMALPDKAHGSPSVGSRLKGLHATMLAYLTTDAAITPALLRKLFAASTDASFNAVTIDDHTSTNDTACLLASGASNARIDTPKAIKSFTAALDEVCQSLAYQIAADGEGATKVVRIEIKNAKDEPSAKAIARAIANSPLVKCAMHGNDPNWGRIVSAAGLAGVPFDPDRATLTLQSTPVFKAGQPLKFNPDAVSKSLAQPEVLVTLDCRLGKSSTTLWTCDLSKDYVTINADYHT